MINPDARRAEVLANLADVRQRIDAACRTAGRPAGEVTLIGVTKFFPVSDAVLLAEAGLPDLGESRDQEAATKVAEFATSSEAAVRWHFIGRLQTNKARSVARYADLVHSVDRPDLVTALAAGANRAGRVLSVLVQANLDHTADADQSTDRGGVAGEDLLRLADRVAGTADLHLAGVMAIAPLDSNPDPAFAELARLAGLVRSAYPDASILSAGMSGDLESAIAHGATHVRVGTALLGRRATKFG